MHYIPSVSPRGPMRACLADLAPAQREQWVVRRAQQGLRELFPGARTTRVTFSTWRQRSGRRAGYEVQLVCHLPARLSELDPRDRRRIATFAESQLGVALLPLCRRIWMVEMNVGWDSLGDPYCIATLRVPSLRPRHLSRRLAALPSTA